MCGERKAATKHNKEKKENKEVVLPGRAVRDPLQSCAHVREMHLSTSEAGT